MTKIRKVSKKKRKQKQRKNKHQSGGKRIVKVSGFEVVEMPITMTPVQVMPTAPQDGDTDEGGAWTVGFDGTVAEIVCERQTKITFAPTFLPQVRGTVYAFLVELSCHPKKDTQQDEEMVVGVQMSVFGKEGKVVNLCRAEDAASELKIKGYTRLAIAIDPSILMPSLAVRSALTVTPVSRHDVHVVACALAAIRMER